MNITSQKTKQLIINYSHDDMLIDPCLTHNAMHKDSDQYAEQLEQQFLHELASTRYVVYEQRIRNHNDGRKKHNPDYDRVYWDKWFTTLDLAEAQKEVANSEGVYRIVEEKILY